MQPTKNPNHSKKKGVLLNILNIPSATFVCCIRVMVYAWPLWGWGKNVWAGDWMVAVKINLLNLSVNHIRLLRAPETSEVLFYDFNSLEEELLHFSFHDWTMDSETSSFLLTNHLQNELGIVARKVEFITWFSFMYLQGPQKIHFRCMQPPILSMSCILGENVWRGKKSEREFRISFAQSIEWLTSVHIYASGWRWLMWLLLARFSVWFRNL